MAKTNEPKAETSTDEITDINDLLDLRVYVSPATQKQIDKHYAQVKKDGKKWLYEYVKNLNKRATKEQGQKILYYADNYGIAIAGELNKYVQESVGISKKCKKQMDDYIRNVNWLPLGIDEGYLDGYYVERRYKNPELMDMLQKAFGPMPGNTEETDQQDTTGNDGSDNTPINGEDNA